MSAVAPTPRRTATSVTVEGRTVELSNLDKVLYPKAGFTKAQVIDYYARVAPVLLPHLKGRPLSLKRYPDGVEAPHFYQKECPANKPDWMPTCDVWSDTRGGTLHYCTANDLPSLVWLANAGDLELHTFLHRGPKVERPTMMVFDLDPGPGADVLDCARLAVQVRAELGQHGLQAFAKVSGGKGLHLQVPLNTPVTYEETRDFSRALAESFARRHPGVTAVMKKSERGGRVFVDWSQNNEHKTTVCVYSLRGQPTPTVSAPVAWHELEDAAAAGRPQDLVFTPEAALRRVARLGDLFAPVLTLKQRLPPATAPSPRPKRRRGRAAPAPVDDLLGRP